MKLHVNESNNLSRYIHSMIGELESRLEDQGYYSRINNDANTLLIEFWPEDGNRGDAMEYSFPISALDEDFSTLEKEASHIVDILMGVATFEDYFDATNNSLNTYILELEDMDNKELLDHFNTIILQNNGTRGKYMDMINAIKEEILSRMS